MHLRTLISLPYFHIHYGQLSLVPIVQGYAKFDLQAHLDLLPNATAAIVRSRRSRLMVFELGKSLQNVPGRDKKLK